MEASPLIWIANLWTGFYIARASVMKVLTKMLQFLSFQFSLHTVSIYLFKINNDNTKTLREISSKLTVKIPELS